MNDALPQTLCTIEIAQDEFRRLQDSLIELRHSVTELNNYNENASRFLAEASKLNGGLNFPDLNAVSNIFPIERHYRGKADPQLRWIIAQQTRAIAEEVRDAEVRRLLFKLADDLESNGGERGVLAVRHGEPAANNSLSRAG